MQRILFVFPNAWDRRQLASCRAEWDARIQVLFSEPTDEDCPADFDPHAWLERESHARRGRIDGVTSSSDYPGATLAGALSAELGLPGSTPQSVLLCSHKYYSRIAQREVIPEATPLFSLLDTSRPPEEPPPMGFPCFVKPVKGAFSVLARRVDSMEELRAFLASDAVQEFARDYLALFNVLLRDLAEQQVDGTYFLAEALLSGAMATVEGFARADGEVEVLGVVDSVRDPATNSFVRFDYPSALAEAVQERMGNVARRAIRRMGLRSTLFNIEMIHDEARDSVHVIEINPRICGQFADLYAKVDGTSSYSVALSLACGAEVERTRGAAGCATASSFPLRVFEPCRVVRAPSTEDLRAAEALFPGTLVWSEVSAGQELVDFERLEDGKSHRYGIVNLGGASRAEVEERCAAVRERLGFAFGAVG